VFQNSKDLKDAIIASSRVVIIIIIIIIIIISLYFIYFIYYMITKTLLLSLFTTDSAISFAILFRSPEGDSFIGPGGLGISGAK